MAASSFFIICLTLSKHDHITGLFSTTDFFAVYKFVHFLFKFQEKFQDGLGIFRIRSFNNRKTFKTPRVVKSNTLLFNNNDQLRNCTRIQASNYETYFKEKNASGGMLRELSA